MAGVPSEALVDQATRGDRAAIGELLERHLPGLLTYVRLHAGDLLLQRESCADLAHSACREVLEGLDGFEYRGEAAFRKWLFVTALNKIRERHRRLKAAMRDVGREIDLPPGPDGESGVDIGALRPSFATPSKAAIADEDMERLERAFAELSDDHRQVITLARVVGMSHAEIAVEMGRTEGAVRVLLHRALFRLGWSMNRRPC